MEAAMDDDRENIRCVMMNSAGDWRCPLKAMSGEVLCERHLLEKQEARKRKMSEEEARKRKMSEEGMGMVPGEQEEAGARKKGRPSGSKNKVVEGTELNVDSGEVPADGIRKRGRPKGSKKGRGRGRPKGSTNKKKTVNGTEESVDEMQVDPRGSGETCGVGVRKVSFSEAREAFNKDMCVTNMEAAMDDDRENITCVMMDSTMEWRCRLKAMSGEVLCEKHILEKQEARKRKMSEEGMGMVPGEQGEAGARKKGRPSGSKNKPVEGTGEVPAGGRPKTSKKGRGRGRPKGSTNKKKTVNGTEESVEEMQVDPRGSGETFGVTSGAGVREVL